MKKFFNYSVVMVLLMTLCIGFSSCSSDEADAYEKLSEKSTIDIEQIVGEWKISEYYDFFGEKGDMEDVGTDHFIIYEIEERDGVNKVIKGEYSYSTNGYKDDWWLYYTPNDEKLCGVFSPCETILELTSTTLRISSLFGYRTYKKVK